MPILIASALMVVWIYLIWMIQKEKINLFHGWVELKLAERHLKILKTFLLVAGISFAVISGVILQIAIFRPPEYEGPDYFHIAFVALWLFIVVTISGLVIFLKGRRKIS
jgi:hypothetical protein